MISTCKTSKVKKTCVNGSYTVEVSLIMPIILGVIILILYVCIYLHDKAVIEYVCLNECLKMSQENNVSPLLHNDISETIDNQIARGTIADWRTNVNIGITDTEIVIVVDSVMGHSQGLVDNLVTENVFSCHVENTELIDSEPDEIKIR